MIDLQNQEVDLSQFQELLGYIKDEEQKRQEKRKGVKCQDDYNYNQSRMALYKRFFFHLVSRTDDQLINQKYDKYLESKNKEKQPDFFQRMKQDQIKRTKMKEFMRQLTMSRGPTSTASQGRRKSAFRETQAGYFNTMSRPHSPTPSEGLTFYKGRKDLAPRKDTALNLTLTKHFDAIDEKLAELEAIVDTKEFQAWFGNE